VQHAQRHTDERQVLRGGRSEVMVTGNEVHLEAGCWGRERTLIGQSLVIGSWGTLSMWLVGWWTGRATQSPATNGERNFAELLEHPKAAASVAPSVMHPVPQLARKCSLRPSTIPKTFCARSATHYSSGARPYSRTDDAPLTHARHRSTVDGGVLYTTCVSVSSPEHSPYSLPTIAVVMSP
jgi:hypothetical protein